MPKLTSDAQGTFTGHLHSIKIGASSLAFNGQNTPITVNSSTSFTEVSGNGKWEFNGKGEWVFTALKDIPFVCSKGNVLKFDRFDLGKEIAKDAMFEAAGIDFGF